MTFACLAHHEPSIRHQGGQFEREADRCPGVFPSLAALLVHLQAPLPKDVKFTEEDV